MTDQLSRAELSEITGVPKSDIHLCLSNAPIWFKIQGYKGCFFAGSVYNIQRQAGVLVGSVNMDLADRQFHGVVFYEKSESIWRLVKLEPKDTAGTKQIHPESTGAVT